MSIVRYETKDELDQSVGELMRHITVADGFDAPQPEQRLVWIVGEYVSPMIQDELEWFARHKPGRSFVQAPCGSYLYIGEIWKMGCHTNLQNFFTHLTMQDSAGKNIQFLFNMLDAEEFEHLLSYLLQEHPYAQDVTKEDYVLSLFVEHEKKRRESYV